MSHRHRYKPWRSLFAARTEMKDLNYLHIRLSRHSSVTRLIDDESCSLSLSNKSSDAELFIQANNPIRSVLNLHLALFHDFRERFHRDQFDAAY